MDISLLQLKVGSDRTLPNQLIVVQKFHSTQILSQLKVIQLQGHPKLRILNESKDNLTKNQETTTTTKNLFLPEEVAENSVRNEPEIIIQE